MARWSAEICQGCAFPPDGARTAAATARPTASAGRGRSAGLPRRLRRRLRQRRVRRSGHVAGRRRCAPGRTTIPRRGRFVGRPRLPARRSERPRRPAVARWPGCFRPRQGMRPSVATVVRRPSSAVRRGPCPRSATRTAPRSPGRRAGRAGSGDRAPGRIVRRPSVPRSPVAISTGIPRARATWRTRTFVSSESHSSTRTSTPSRNPSTDSVVIPRSNTSTGR